MHSLKDMNELLSPAISIMQRRCLVNCLGMYGILWSWWRQNWLNKACIIIIITITHMLYFITCLQYLHARCTFFLQTQFNSTHPCFPFAWNSAFPSRFFPPKLHFHVPSTTICTTIILGFIYSALWGHCFSTATSISTFYNNITFFFKNLQNILNQVSHERTEHIKIECLVVRKKFNNSLLKLLPIFSSFQVIDIFTKSLLLHIFKIIYSK